jgi:meso-butanediol dehydrogenase/(S,S)-butanediol dehydrogenase/diacetyl reductase
MELGLRDKVVIITGAASGIGRASLRAFAAEGARVLAVDINAAQLAAAVEELPAARVKAHAADVTDADQVQTMVAHAVAAFGRLDVMFSNAGGAIPTPTEQQGLADYRRIMALNLDAVYYAVHAALPVMLAQGSGCFLSTSSGAGMNAATGAGGLRRRQGRRDQPDAQHRHRVRWPRYPRQHDRTGPDGHAAGTRLAGHLR